MNEQRLRHSSFQGMCVHHSLMLTASMQRACHVYQDRNYNFLTDNCHAFVAYFMNELQYGGTKKWSMVRLVSRYIPTCPSSPKTAP